MHLYDTEQENSKKILSLGLYGIPGDNLQILCGPITNLILRAKKLVVVHAT